MPIDPNTVQWDDAPQGIDPASVQWDDAPKPVAVQPERKLSLPPKSEHPARSARTAIESIRAFGRGATLGVSDIAGTGLAMLAAGARQAITGEGDQTLAEIKRDIKSGINTERDIFREESPALAYGSEIAGAIAPAVATMGASTPAALGAAAKSAPSLAAAVGKGAALGAAQGALYSGTQQEAGKELDAAKEGALYGGIAGAAFPVVGRALKSAISPAASTNAELKALTDMGVEPTIGQALGGLANKIEQKAQSIPLVGDKISSQRAAAREQFNTGVINEVLKPIGATVKGAGQEAVKEAGDQISAAYNNALGKINGVMFDDTFNASLGDLRNMASNLTPDNARRFEKILSDEVLNRQSPAGGMLPETYKKADSVLGKLASKYQSSGNASESEFGDAVKQLQALLKDQMFRSNPDVAGELKAADTAYAMLTRIEDAAGRAVNNDGIFTPAQLNAAIKSADKSARKRAVARGDALLQDIGRAGQNVLAETVPNSGTVDRGAQIATGALGMANPIVTGAALGAGYGAYTRPIQNALVAAVSKRGATAPKIAQNTNMLLEQAGTRAALAASRENE